MKDETHHVVYALILGSVIQRFVTTHLFDWDDARRAEVFAPNVEVRLREEVLLVEILQPLPVEVQLRVLELYPKQVLQEQLCL